MEVVILAGGFGSRIGEETKSKPKPMIKINKFPIITHIINYYINYGFKEFIICTGYKEKIIRDYFASQFTLVTKQIIKKNKHYLEIYSKTKKIRIKIINTGLNTGTGGRLKKIYNHIKSENFMMTYGDGLSNVNLKKLILCHNKSKKLVTLTAVYPPPRWGALIIDKKNNRVKDIHEKFSHKGDRINGGFFVINKKAISKIKNDKTHWEQEPLRNLAKNNELQAYLHNGFWQPMDTLREKILLNNLSKSKVAPWENVAK